MRYEETQNNEFVLKEYEYVLPFWVIVVGSLFGICTTFIGVDNALNNVQGLIIKRRSSTLLELTTEQAKIFYWLMAILGLALLLWIIQAGAVRSKFEQRIVITTNSIVLPKSIISTELVTIPFYAITNLQVMSGNGQRCANIFVNSKKYTIDAKCLPSQEDFDEILLLVSEAIRQSRGVDET